MFIRAFVEFALIVECELSILRGLACPYMPSRRVLNSIALIKGSSVSDVLIKQIYRTLPELTKNSSLYTGDLSVIIMFLKAKLPSVSIEYLKLIGNCWNPL